MKAEAHSIEVTRRARYFTLGNLNTAKSIWFVLHGYGQLAEYFIRHFEPVSEDHFFIAPEGLSKFYLKDSRGRVGASWMTKEDRLNEIADQFNFLEELAFQYSKRSKLTLNLLGFSQGTATASRWLSNTALSFEHLVLWGGTIAQDADYSTLQRLSEYMTFSFCFGTQDEYLSASDAQWLKTQLNKLGLRYGMHNYNGGHTIEKELLTRIIS